MTTVYLVDLPPEMQERLKQTKVYHMFSYFFEKKRPTYDNWKTLLSMKVYSYSEIFFKQQVAAFFEASVLKEVRILCAIFTIPI